MNADSLVDSGGLRPVQSLEDIFRVAYPRLVASLYAFTGDLTEAQDAVQEAFVRAVTRESRVMAAQSPEAYLCTMARNVARRRWTRTFRLKQRMEQLPVAGPDPVPSPDRVAVIRALGELPQTQREALVRYHVGDQSVEDIADALGASRNTVKSWLARGRAALATLLDETVDDLPAGVQATLSGVRSEVAAVDVRDIRQRGKRRQTRRRLTAGGASALVAASLVALFSLMPAKTVPVGPVGPVRGPLASHQVAMPATTVVKSEIPVDLARSYAVVDVGDKTYALARTNDGGHHWSAWSLPDPLQGGRWKKRVSVQAEPPLEQVLPDVPLVLTPLTVVIGTFITRDSGESWAAVPGGATAPIPKDQSKPPALGIGAAIDEVPLGWPLRARCPDAYPRRDGCRLDAVDPATGIQHELAHQPAVDGTADVTVTDDGSFWQSAGTAVSYSRDRGQSWQQKSVPAGTTQLAVNGRFIYLLTTTDTNRPTEISESTDFGHSWQLRSPATALLTEPVWAASDGTLYANGWLSPLGIQQGPPDLFTSRDGRSFQRATAPAAGDGMFRTVTGAYVTFAAPTLFEVDPREFSCEISADGRTFTPVLTPSGK